MGFVPGINYLFHRTPHQPLQVIASSTTARRTLPSTTANARRVSAAQESILRRKSAPEQRLVKLTRAILVEESSGPRPRLTSLPNLFVVADATTSTKSDSTIRLNPRASTAASRNHKKAASKSHKSSAQQATSGTATTEPATSSTTPKFALSAPSHSTHTGSPVKNDSPRRTNRTPAPIKLFDGVVLLPHSRRRRGKSKDRSYIDRKDEQESPAPSPVLTKPRKRKITDPSYKPVGQAEAEEESPVPSPSPEKSRKRLSSDEGDMETSPITKKQRKGTKESVDVDEPTKADGKALKSSSATSKPKAKSTSKPKSKQELKQKPKKTVISRVAK